MRLQKISSLQIQILNNVDLLLNNQRERVPDFFLNNFIKFT